MDENGIAKLADFGTAELHENGDDTLTKTEGTYHFLSPECCNPDVKKFGGRATDIWALGVTIYAMIYNELPFYADTDMKLLEVINQDE